MVNLSDVISSSLKEKHCRKLNQRSPAVCGLNAGYVRGRVFGVNGGVKGEGVGSHTCCIHRCRTAYTSVYKGWTAFWPDGSEKFTAQLSYSEEKSFVPKHTQKI